MEDIKINIQKIENLVIGAGVFGLSASNYLLDKGQEVCLIDKSSDFDEASSNALGRIDPILGGAGHGNETKPLDVAKISFLKFSALESVDALSSKAEIFVTPSTKLATSSPNSFLTVS